MKEKMKRFIRKHCKLFISVSTIVVLVAGIFFVDSLKSNQNLVETSSDTEKVGITSEEEVKTTEITTDSLAMAGPQKVNAAEKSAPHAERRVGDHRPQDVAAGHEAEQYAGLVDDRHAVDVAITHHARDAPDVGQRAGGDDRCRHHVADEFGQHVADFSCVDIERGQQVPLADESDQATAVVEHRRLVNPVPRQRAPGERDLVARAHGDDVRRHDLVGVMERATVEAFRKHGLIGGDGRATAAAAGDCGFVTVGCRFGRHVILDPAC